MTRQRRYLVTFIACLITITLLRETGTININYNTILDRRKSNSLIETSTGGFTMTRDTSSIDKEMYDDHIADISIRVIYEGDTLYQDSLSNKFIDLQIDTLNKSFCWVPLLKPIQYTVHCSVNSTVYLSKKDEQLITNMNLRMTGNISLHGDAVIVGICSRREAIHAILSAAAKDFQKTVREYLVNHAPLKHSALPAAQG